MTAQTRRSTDALGPALYILLMCFSFFSDAEYLPAAVKYAVNLAVLAWASLAFLAKPQLARARLCAQLLALFFLPYLVFWLWSAGLWFVRFQPVAYIVRGTKSTVYMLTDLLLVCAAVYLFGRRAMAYTLAAMTAANACILFKTAVHSGLVPLLREFWQLLASFATQTGPIMSQLELHGLAFGWGAFLVWLLTQRRPRIGVVAVCTLFFALTLKRIAVLGVACAGLLWLAVRRRPAALRWMPWAMAASVGLAAFGFLAAVKSGLFYPVAERLGLNLMYRDVLYRYYSAFFTLSPAYVGQGIRFIYTFGTTEPSAYEAVHSVYLELYLEVGFWCWWLWLIYELGFRVRWVAARFGFAPAALLMVMNAYVFCTYLTDNTSFYYCINVIYRLAVVCACCTEEGGPAP